MTNNAPEQPDGLPPTPEDQQQPTPGLPPMPTKPPRKPLTPIAAGLIGLAAGAAIMGGIWAISSSNFGGPGTFTLEGTFTLTDGVSDTGGGCQGTGGYDDIADGTSVTVYGADGDVVGTGELSDSSFDGMSICTFDIAIEDVPKGEKFYKVEVSHRGTLQLSAEEAENGELAGSLG
jgi:hypothetical protein